MVPKKTFRSAPVGRRIQSLVVAGALAATAHAAAAAAAVPSDAAIARVADLYGGSAVRDGAAVGIGIAVVRAGQAPRYFFYGVADADRATPFTPDTRFEIASLTKVLTTNLVGQEVAAGRLSLDRTLASDQAVFGGLPAPSRAVTIGDLGTFTAGYPTLAGQCGDGPLPKVHACLPKGGRPSIATYDAADFAAYFHSTPCKCATLPADYNYSDFSIGILGLLLAADPTRRLDGGALDGWNRMLHDRLLAPLGMDETTLLPQPSGRDVAIGYQLPVTTVTTVACGGALGCPLATVDLNSVAGPYRHTPNVTVVGGGGIGAIAAAAIDDNGMLTGITVTRGGYFYVAPAAVTFRTSCEVHGRALIRDGQVVGVALGDSSGCPDGVAIPVTFTGGLRPGGGGRNAAGVAYASAGHVVLVRITDGGWGYVPPLHLTLDGEAGVTNVVPIWAPAGGLTSSLKDMARFAGAALSPFDTGAPGTPSAIRDGFLIAETPRVCIGAGCPENTLLGGLAWEIQVSDPFNIFKDGGLPGFSSQVQLLPTLGTALVVFVNSWQDPLQRTGDTAAPALDGPEATPAGLTAPILAGQIGNALSFEGGQLP